VIGFPLSAAPAMLLGMTVSGRTVLIIAALYVAYHTFENYVIAPRVYGDRLKLSNLAVVLAFAVGAQIGGVIGALIALPVAAVYPSVETNLAARPAGANRSSTSIGRSRNKAPPDYRAAAAGDGATRPSAVRTITQVDDQVVAVRRQATHLRSLRPRTWRSIA